MSEHTKEPWHLSQDGQHVLSRTGEMSFAHVAEVFHDVEDARRIVTCVNALAGVSTEHLEQYGLPDFAQKISDLAQQRDKLLAALEGLTDDICSLIDESSGVANLHLNGDIAFWSELEAGGQFERLTHLPDALRVIAEVKGQP